MGWRGAREVPSDGEPCSGGDGGGGGDGDGVSAGERCGRRSRERSVWIEQELRTGEWNWWDSDGGARTSGTRGKGPGWWDSWEEPRLVEPGGKCLVQTRSVTGSVGQCS